MDNPYGTIEMTPTNANPSYVDSITQADQNNRHYASYGDTSAYHFEIFLVGKHDNDSTSTTNHFFDSGGEEDAEISPDNPQHRITVRSSTNNNVIQVLTRDNVAGYTTGYLMENASLGTNESFIINFKGGSESRLRVNGGVKQLVV